jgi:hypothetical protein
LRDVLYAIGHFVCNCLIERMKTPSAPARSAGTILVIRFKCAKSCSDERRLCRMRRASDACNPNSKK